MHLVGLEAVRFVMTPTLIIIIRSCASFIQRSAFRLIESRETSSASTPPLITLIGCSSLIFHWYAFGRTENHEICQNASLHYTICYYVFIL